MAELDPRDALLQEHTPAIMVPRFGPRPRLKRPGHRYLVAKDGLWLEVHRPWLYARTPLAITERVLPFGELDQLVAYEFFAGDFQRVLERFLPDAQASMPNECAAWALWNERTRTLDYRPLLADSASPGGVTFHRPRLEAHEHLAIDLHSHGTLDAFFSDIDDVDDLGEVKVSVVVGSLDQSPTWATRLCLLGEFVYGLE